MSYIWIKGVWSVPYTKRKVSYSDVIEHLIALLNYNIISINIDTAHLTVMFLMYILYLLLKYTHTQ